MQAEHHSYFGSDTELTIVRNILSDNANYWQGIGCHSCVLTRRTTEIHTAIPCYVQYAGKLLIVASVHVKIFGIQKPYSVSESDISGNLHKMLTSTRNAFL